MLSLPLAPQVMGQGWHKGLWCFREDTTKLWARSAQLIAENIGVLGQRLSLRATAKSSLALSEVPVLRGDQRARAFRRRPLPSHPRPVREHKEEVFFLPEAGLSGDLCL